MIEKGGALHALPCDYIVSGHFCSRSLDWLLNTKNAHTTSFSYYAHANFAECLCMVTLPRYYPLFDVKDK